MNRWRRVIGELPNPLVVIVAAMLLGAGAGALSELMKYLLLRLLKVWSEYLTVPSFSWRLLYIPVAGTLFAFIYQRYVARESYAHGTDKLIRLLRNPSSGYRMRPGGILNSILCCVSTVGFGASAGSEGPAAYSGAALGSNMGRLLRFSPSWMRIFVGIGAGAGIAGIFKAPIGGALYTLEVLELPLTTVPVVALVLACVTASSTAFLLSGETFDISLTEALALEPIQLGWMGLLGVVCGLYGLWYIWSKNSVARLFARIEKRWAAPLISGILTGIVLLCIPALFGEGGGVMLAIVDNGIPAAFSHGLFPFISVHETNFLIVAGIILLIKGGLVAAANYGGGVAGEMVPALFIGCIAGWLFGTLLGMIPGITVSPWYMALAGMGGMLAVSTHAPLMAAFIICECTGTLQMLPAYLVCVLVSYGVLKLCRPASVWINGDRDDLIDLYRAMGKLDGGKNPGKEK